MEKDDGSAISRFVYDANNRLIETDDIGTIEAEFTYEPALYANVISQRREAAYSFYLFDGIKNVRQLTNSAQSITDEYGFDAWGLSLGSTGSTANSQQYKGQLLAYRRDPDVGPEEQYSLHHRNYDPKVGRLTSADPAEEDLNLYRMVNNNPINAEDPSGLEPPEPEKDSKGRYISGGGWDFDGFTVVNDYEIRSNWPGFILSTPGIYVFWPLFGGGPRVNPTPRGPTILDLEASRKARHIYQDQAVNGLTGSSKASPDIPDAELTAMSTLATANVEFYNLASGLPIAVGGVSRSGHTILSKIDDAEIPALKYGDELVAAAKPSQSVPARAHTYANTGQHVPHGRRKQGDTPFFRGVVVFRFSI